MSGASPDVSQCRCNPSGEGSEGLSPGNRAGDRPGFAGELDAGVVRPVLHFGDLYPHPLDSIHVLDQDDDVLSFVAVVVGRDRGKKSCLMNVSPGYGPSILDFDIDLLQNVRGRGVSRLALGARLDFEGI